MNYEVEHVAKDCEVRSLLQVTEHELERAHDEVARLTELKELLEKHPATQRILELLGRKY